MSTIVGAIQSIVRDELQRIRIAELGLVDAVHPHSSSSDSDNYGCDVKLKNSGLLLKGVPIITGHIGTAAIPNVGDLVLVVFDKGDINQPIVIGRLYDEADRPPLNNPDELIFRLPLAADDNQTIRSAIRNIQANSPPREILIEMPPKITVRITDGTVHAVAGKTEMKLDQPDGSGGTVTVIAGQTTISMDQDGNIQVDSNGDIDLSARGDLSVTAMNVNIQANQSIDIKAAMQATMEAQMGATLNGTLSTTVQGTTIAIQGITSFSP